MKATPTLAPLPGFPPHFPTLPFLWVAVLLLKGAGRKPQTVNKGTSQQAFCMCKEPLEQQVKTVSGGEAKRKNPFPLLPQVLFSNCQGFGDLALAELLHRGLNYEKTNVSAAAFVAVLP